MYGDDPEKNQIGRGNFYPQYDRRATHQRTAYSIPFPNLLLTAASGLHGRAEHGPVRTKDAAIAQLWLKPLATSLAVIEELARIGRHAFGFLMPAIWTGDCGNFDHGRPRIGCIGRLLQQHRIRALRTFPEIAAITADFFLPTI
jgi:hypothetical protein